MKDIYNYIVPCLAGSGVAETVHSTLYICLSEGTKHCLFSRRVNSRTFLRVNLVFYLYKKFIDKYGQTYSLFFFKIFFCAQHIMINLLMTNARDQI